MEDHDHDLINIKTESEDVEEKFDPDEKFVISEMHESNIVEEVTNCFDVKPEPCTRQEDENDEILLENKFKIDMKVESYDEFCDDDRSFIYFEESNRSMLKEEKTYVQSSGSEKNTTQNSITDKKVFICYKCSYKAKAEASLKLHQVVHDEKRLRCDECSYKAKSKRILIRHQLIHNQEKPREELLDFEKCSDRTNMSESLKGQMLLHTEECINQILIKSEVENPEEKSILFDGFESSSNSIDVKLETTTWPKSEENSINYEEFNSGTIKTENLLHTEQCINQILIKSEVEDPDEKSILSDGFKSSLNSIDVKLETTTSSKSGKNSINYEEFNTCTIKTETETSDVMYIFDTNSGIEANKNKILFKCDKCDFVGKTQHRLKRHQITHTNERPYKCNQCSFRAKSKGVLKGHQLVHTNDRALKCDKCDYSAKIKSKLAQHQIKHSEEKPFECNKCSYRTNRLSCLKSQIFVHRANEKNMTTEASQSRTNEVFPNKNKCKLEMDVVTNNYDQLNSHTIKTEKTLRQTQPIVYRKKHFKCTDCDFVGKNRSRLKRHQLKHTNVKPFKCEKCSFRCKAQRCLVDHQLVHTDYRPFKCDKCDYSAKINRELKRHQKIHMKINPYKCDTCNYRTHSELFLKRHQSIHEKLLVVEKFGCTECGYVTKYKASLTKHLLLHRL